MEREVSSRVRESVSCETLVSFLSQFRECDVAETLERIRVPTLVIHRREFRGINLGVAQLIASRIPGGTLSALPGSSDKFDAPVQTAMWRFVSGTNPPYSRDSVSVTSEPAAHSPEARKGHEASAFRTILFTDLVDHTLMMQRLGDEAGRAVLREHERITRDLLRQHGGIEVKTDGDSFMATFGSATAAVACAVDLQRAFAARNESADESIIIRAGLNVGEPIEEGGDYFGSAAILAARIKDQAGAGEILVPEAVRHLLSGKNFVYADRGETMLKGFEDAVRLYEVRWRS